MSDHVQGTVLVVDDNDANRYVLVRLLERAGYHVVEAATGKDGLERLPLGIDLAIVDVNLPDIKGTDLARQIKESPQTSSIMVLNMSASFTRTQDRIIGLECGADGYLTQPLDPPEFIATVKSLMRMRRAEENVRRANKELEQFAYAASHDLQEPLRTISSYLEILDQRYGSALDERGKHYLAYTVNAAKRMRDLIRDLLSLAQIERLPMALKATDLSLPLTDALENLKLKVQESGATVTFGELPTAAIDRSLIAQVFQNFIANAIKFRGESPPSIVISAAREAAFHVISIQDNGIGISAEHTDRIFGIFQRLHAADKYPGNGIGLSLCRRLIDRHGGSVGVSSVVGAGSRFWFTLPV